MIESVSIFAIILSSPPLQNYNYVQLLNPTHTSHSRDSPPPRRGGNSIPARDTPSSRQLNRAYISHHTSYAFLAKLLLACLLLFLSAVTSVVAVPSAKIVVVSVASWVAVPNVGFAVVVAVAATPFCIINNLNSIP